MIANLTGASLNFKPLCESGWYSIETMEKGRYCLRCGERHVREGKCGGDCPVRECVIPPSGEVAALEGGKVVGLPEPSRFCPTCGSAPKVAWRIERGKGGPPVDNPFGNYVAGTEHFFCPTCGKEGRSEDIVFIVSDKVALAVLPGERPDVFSAEGLNHNPEAVFEIAGREPARKEEILVLK